MEKHHETGIWIDQNKALIVTIEDGNVRLDKFESDFISKERIEGESKKFTRMGNQYSNFEKDMEEKNNHLRKKFLHNIFEKIKLTERVLIMGPAFMKTELNKTLSGIQEFSGKEIQVESADSMTDNQLIAKVKSHFGQT